MRILTPGHRYELANFENLENPKTTQVIQFIQKEPIAEGSTELRTILDGTTNEEVMAMLIDRLKFLNAKVPIRETSISITKIEEALMWQEKRTEERKARAVEGTNAK